MEYAYLKLKTATGERPVQLSSVPLTIGRHSSNRLVIDDTMSSRFHCVIEQGAEGYVVRDLQSRNGTTLNGQRVMNAPLKSGDVVIIGGIQMTVVVHKVSESVAGQAEAKPRKMERPKPPVTTAAGSPKSAFDNVDELEVVDELEIVEELPETAGDQSLSSLRVLRRTADAMINQAFDVEAIGLINCRGKQMVEGTEAQGTAEVVLLLKLILLICFRSRATDIHLEPREVKFLLRIRMDGNLLDIAEFDRELGVKLTALVKVLCELDTTQRYSVQEGHFASKAPQVFKGPATPQTQPTPPVMRRVDYRVSLVPSLHGQKLVIRIFDAANAPNLMEELNLPAPIAHQISEELTKDAGLILVCGPTGSGKTTTLYSLIRSCGASFRNIVTIEDPVEVQIDGTTQLPVDEEQGNSFAALLRSVLRQDPDVIMVGEIRDSETARIALQASMTGHLVLSTIHTRDTIGTIFRMLDLGIEGYMVAQGLHLVLAQRLVRTLCMACRRPHPPTPEDRVRLGKVGETVDKIYAPLGCPKCLGTGYYSRRAFFEFLALNDKMRDQITRDPSITALQGMVGSEFASLSTNGYQLVAQGLTSIDEVDRAVGR